MEKIIQINNKASNALYFLKIEDNYFTDYFYLKFQLLQIINVNCIINIHNYKEKNYKVACIHKTKITTVNDLLCAPKHVLSCLDVRTPFLLKCVYMLQISLYKKPPRNSVALHNEHLFLVYLSLEPQVWTALLTSSQLSHSSGSQLKVFGSRLSSAGVIYFASLQ